MNIKLTEEINSYLSNPQDFPNFHIFNLKEKTEFGSFILFTKSNDFTLLRSLQLAYYIETKQFYSINDLAPGLYRYLVKYIHNNKISDNTNSNEDIYKNVHSNNKGIKLSNQKLLTINSFNFFKYLSDITPNIDLHRNEILRTMPQILSQIFQCSIDMYQIEKSNQVFLSQWNNIKYSKHGPKLNILMVEEYNACMVMVKASANVGVIMNKFNKKIEDNIVKVDSNSTFGHIYSEFKSKKLIFNSNSIARLHKLTRASDSVRALKENIARKQLGSEKDSTNLNLAGDLITKLNKNLKYFGFSPLKFLAEGLKSEELGYTCAVIDLVFQFEKDSQNHQSVIDSRQDFDCDLKELLSLLDDSIRVDLRTKEEFYSLEFEAKYAKRRLRQMSLTSKVALGKFLKSALVISGIRNCYAILNVFFLTDKNEGIMLQILPFGVYVDRELSELIFFVYYDGNSDTDLQDLKDFKFQQFQSLDELNKFLEGNVEKPIQALFQEKQIIKPKSEEVKTCAKVISINVEKCIQKNNIQGSTPIISREKSTGRSRLNAERSYCLSKDKFGEINQVLTKMPTYHDDLLKYNILKADNTYVTKTKKSINDCDKNPIILKENLKTCVETLKPLKGNLVPPKKTKEFDKSFQIPLEESQKPQKESPIPQKESPIPPKETPIPPKETLIPPKETPDPPKETPIPPKEFPKSIIETPISNDEKSKFERETSKLIKDSIIPAKEPLKEYPKIRKNSSDFESFDFNQPLNKELLTNLTSTPKPTQVFGLNEKISKKINPHLESTPKVNQATENIYVSTEINYSIENRYRISNDYVINSDKLLIEDKNSDSFSVMEERLAKNGDDTKNKELITDQINEDIQNSKLCDFLSPYERWANQNAEKEIKMLQAIVVVQCEESKLDHNYAYFKLQLSQADKIIVNRETKVPGVFEGTFEFKTGYFNAKDVRFMREKVDKEDHLKEELVNMDCREMYIEEVLNKAIGLYESLLKTYEHFQNLVGNEPKNLTPFNAIQKIVSESIRNSLSSFGSINKKCMDLKENSHSSDNFLFLDQIVQSLKYPIYFISKNYLRMHEVLIKIESITDYFPGLYGMSSINLAKQCNKLLKGLNQPYLFMHEIELLYRKILNRAGLHHQCRFDIQNAVTNVSNVLDSYRCIQTCQLVSDLDMQLEYYFEKKVSFIVSQGSGDNLKLDGSIKIYDDYLILSAAYIQDRKPMEAIYNFQYVDFMSGLCLLVGFYFTGAQHIEFYQVGSIISLVPSKSELCMKLNGNTECVIKSAKNEGLNISLSCKSANENLLLFNFLNDLIKLQEQKL